MINTTELCQKFESEIQDYAAEQGVDREFIIYSTVGERKPSERVEDTNRMKNYICGSYELSPSTLTPLTGLTIAQFSATVTFICDIHKSGKDANGNYIEVELLKNLLDSFVQSKNGTVADGVLTYYSLTSIGAATIASSETGEYVPVALSIYYIYVSNGFFGEDVKLRIDGIRMWYTAFAETKNKTTETALMDGSKRAKSVATELVNGVDFTVPLTMENRYVFSEDNEENLNYWHWVSVQVGDDTPKTYRMIFNSCVTRAEPTLIASVTASMTEAISRLALPDPNNIEKVNLSTNNIDGTKTAAEFASEGVTIPASLGYVIIDWGDGSWSEIAPGMSRTAKHTYKDTGGHNIEMYFFKHAKE